MSNINLESNRGEQGCDSDVGHVPLPFRFGFGFRLRVCFSGKSLDDIQSLMSVVDIFYSVLALYLDQTAVDFV